MSILLNPICEKLISLRLHGMHQALKEQLTTQETFDLSFEDRLGMLVEREVLARENQALSARLTRARLKQNAEIEDVRPSSSRGLDKSHLRQLGQCDWVRAKANLIITGPSGVGKTYLASALARKACLLGFTSRYYRLSNLLSELDAGRNDGKFQRVIRQLGKFGVLIIDDFLLSNISEGEEKDLFELIEERHDTGSTILTSQNPVNLWHGLMPNPAIADAILDRLVHGATRLELKGDSLRKPTRRTELDSPPVPET